MTNRTRKRAKERAQQRTRRRQRLILAAVAIIAVVGTIFAVIATRPVEVQVDEELLTRYSDLPTSFSDRGFPILGNPDAPARVEEYSSFACPACADFNENVTPGVVDRVRSGEAHFVYVPVLLSAENDRAAAAALCAAEQDRFWEYHDLLFNWQQVYEATAFQTARIVAGAEALGLDVDAFNECRSSARISETLDNAQAAYAQAGGTGTPTTVVNSEAVSSTLGGISNAINAVMASADPVPVEVNQDEPEVDAEEDTDAEAEEETDAEADDADAEEETDAEADDADAEEEPDADAAEEDADADATEDADAEEENVDADATEEDADPTEEAADADADEETDNE